MLRTLDTQELEKQVRHYIYLVFCDRSHPPTVELIMERFKTSRADIIAILYQLEKDHLIVLDKKINKITIAHPFAGVATAFEISTQSNKKYFASCAWLKLNVRSLNIQLTI